MTETASGEGGGTEVTDRQDKGVPPTPCPLCPSVLPESSPRTAEFRIEEYRTAQRELLEQAIAPLVPEAAGEIVACRVCLETIERQIQGRQLIAVHGERYYTDLSLGEIPILSTPARVGANERYTGRGVTIAVIDSGFYPHPDLTRPANRILAIYDAVRRQLVDDIAGLASLPPGIEEWHGTMTACAAAGNGFLSKGLYRGLASEASLVLVKVMTPEFGIKTPEVVRALRWVRDNRERYGIRVVNMSLGVDERAISIEHPVVALVEELSRLGVVVVAAAGNNPFTGIKPPGAAPSAITVGGYNDHNSTDWMHRELWYHSRGDSLNGEHKPEILAPAIWVAAPVLPHTQVRAEADALFRLAAADDDDLMGLIPRLATETLIGERLLTVTDPLYARSLVLRRISEEKLITPNYKHVDGTSFAAPIISSVIAQMLEVCPGLQPDAIKEILCRTAEPLAGIPAEFQGHGIVQARGALEAVVQLWGEEPARPHMDSADRVPPSERLPS